MYDVKNLEKLSAFNKAVPKAMASFQAFDEAALADGAIPKKYKELIAVAVALTTQCPYCIDVHKMAALKAGVTEQELAEAAFVAAALRAGGAVAHGAHLVD
jgi:AhpD family alkylhydroperoxidase